MCQVHFTLSYEHILSNIYIFSHESKGNCLNLVLLFLLFKAGPCFQYNNTCEVATISKVNKQLFKLQMIVKDSVPGKVATISEWPLYPRPLYPRYTVYDFMCKCKCNVNVELTYSIPHVNHQPSDDNPKALTTMLAVLVARHLVTGRL